MIAEKRCSCCRRVKPADEFYVCNGINDGLQSRCKKCQKAGQKVESLAAEARIRRSGHRRRVRLKKGESCLDGVILRECRSCGNDHTLDHYPSGPRAHRGLMWTCNACRAMNRKTQAVDPEAATLEVYRDRVREDEVRTAAAWDILRAQTLHALG